jgi:hypothetical protein
MDTICLALPTNRECAAALRALLAEAAYAVAHFDVAVHVLVLDSAPPAAVAGHAAVLGDTPAPAGVVVHHLDEPAQRAFLRTVIDRAGLVKPDLVAELMLPAAVSYGACTNRAFLLAAALGCASVHRRDSDSRYQNHRGEPVFPIHHELRALGRPAGAVAGLVESDRLDPALRERPVAMVGASFIGELSVDIGAIRDRDPEVYHDIVSLWAPLTASPQHTRELVAESFTGAGAAPFTGDHAVLDVVDPMRVDMCNIAFHGVPDRIPLSPATDTIGSDYFLIHVVRCARLPGVLHNRHIENFHTPERKSDAGFAAYQLRLAKFFLSMLYLHVVHDRMAELGDALLDEQGHPSAAVIAELVRASTRLPVTENEQRLDRLAAALRRLGGRYALFAAELDGNRARLLEEARRDMADHALLIEAWASLVEASRAAGVLD